MRVFEGIVPRINYGNFKGRIAVQMSTYGRAVSRTKCNSGSIGCGYLPFGLRQQVVVNL